MPWTSSFDAERHALFITATGVLTDEELRSGTTTTFQDPRQRSTLRVLLDYSGTTNILVTVATVQQLATNKAFLPGSRRAFLASSDLAYGMGRMYKAYAEGGLNGEVRVFRDRGRALAWLNEDAPPDKIIT